MASLLTVAAVSRRVREFGTLKALGWRSTRIIAQVMGESLVLGLAGGAAGVGLGFAGAAIITKVAPRLSATLATPGGRTLVRARPRGGHVRRGGQPLGSGSAAHTVLVPMSAPVSAGRDRGGGGAGPGRRPDRGHVRQLADRPAAARCRAGPGRVSTFQ